MSDYYQIAENLVNGLDQIDSNGNIYCLADIIGWMTDDNAGNNDDLNAALCAMATRSESYDYTDFLQMIADFMEEKELLFDM